MFSHLLNLVPAPVLSGAAPAVLDWPAAEALLLWTLAVGLIATGLEILREAWNESHRGSPNGFAFFCHNHKAA